MDPVTMSVGTATLSLLPYLGDTAKGLVNRLLDINQKTPLIVGQGKTLRVQSPDKRISWGLARRNGEFVVVLLSEKEDSTSQSVIENLTKSYPGLTEAKVVGRAYSVNPEDNSRTPIASPLFPGASIGHINGFPGTIGCVVRNNAGKGHWLGVTSASHVLGITNTANKKDLIISPGHPDGPKSSDARCGLLSRYIYLTHYSKAPTANYLCCADVALVQVDEEYEGEGVVPDANWVLDPKTNGQMRLKGFVKWDDTFDRSGETVYKVGRTTDLTQGTLDIVGLQRQSIQLPDGRLYLYTDVMTVERAGAKPFSEPGDSGALVYTEDAFALGFIIGGTDHTSFVSPIDQCLREIKAELVL